MQLVKVQVTAPPSLFLLCTQSHPLEVAQAGRRRLQTQSARLGLREACLPARSDCR